MAEPAVPVAEQVMVAGTSATVTASVAAGIQSVTASQTQEGKLRLVGQGLGLFRLEYSYVKGWGKALAVVGVVWLVLATVISQTYLGTYYGGYSSTSAYMNTMVVILSICLFLVNAIIPACLIAGGLFFGRKKDLCTVTISQVKEGICQVSAMGMTSPQGAHALQTMFQGLRSQGAGPMTSSSALR